MLQMALAFAIGGCSSYVSYKLEPNYAAPLLVIAIAADVRLAAAAHPIDLADIVLLAIVCTFGWLSPPLIGSWWTTRSPRPKIPPSIIDPPTTPRPLGKS